MKTGSFQSLTMLAPPPNFIIMPLPVKKDR